MGMKYHLTKEEFDALDDKGREHYREVNGKPGTYRLQLDDNPVAEFRQTNSDLMKQLEAAVASKTTAEAKAAAADAVLEQYRDEDGNRLDPDEVKRMRADLKQKSGGKDKATLDDALAPLQRQIAALQESLNTQKAQTEAERKAADKEALRAALAAEGASVLEPATAGMVVREMVESGHYEWDRERREVVAKGRDSEGNPLTPKAFLDGYRTKAPNLFKSNGRTDREAERNSGGERKGDVVGDVYRYEWSGDPNTRALERGKAAAEAKKAGKKLEWVDNTRPNVAMQ